MWSTVQVYNSQCREASSRACFHPETLGEFPDLTYARMLLSVLERHGPFWPVGFRQLCPTPVHIIICPDAEALWSKDTQGFDCKMGIMRHPWRRKVLVFDSEKYTKNPLCQMPEDSGPSLQFESSYPYHYSTLLSHLNEITKDPRRSAYVKKEALCKTLARNTCFLLTVTDFEVNTAESCSSKLGVVLTARVHPGETPSSWVMKGVLDFLTSEEPLAQILLYCDLHGHSRKPHVFMYGCNQASAESSSVSSYLRERIFPFLVSQKNTRRAAMVNPLFVNRYANRSNGGIPIYSQERLLERAKVKGPLAPGSDKPSCPGWRTQRWFSALLI
ncbi:UNVERIFIED_CONTAM: hypothetical protein FKN15_063875 [Acipenser sinensis]